MANRCGGVPEMTYARHAASTVTMTDMETRGGSAQSVGLILRMLVSSYTRRIKTVTPLD